jgi:hypothetical protein
MLLLSACSLHPKPQASSMPSSLPASLASSQPSPDLPTGLFVPISQADPRSPLIVTRANLEALAVHLIRERERRDDKDADLVKRARTAEDATKIAEAHYLEAKLAAIIGPVAAAAASALVTALIAHFAK